MKLTADIIKEWEMYFGEDFYIDGPLSTEIQERVFASFVDSIFEKAPNLIELDREEIESMWDLELSDECIESEENLAKVAEIFCSVIQDKDSAEVMTDIIDDFKETIENSTIDDIPYFLEEAPTLYNLAKDNK